MRKFSFALFALMLAAPVAFHTPTTLARSAAVVQEQESPRVLTPPHRTRKRRWRAEGRRHRGIRSAFKHAGKSAGRGGKRLGQNVARGRVLRGGKEFGKGMGGFGKHTGKGVSRTMRRVFKP